MVEPLNFVLLCDSPQLSRWQLASIEEAVGHGVARPVGVVLRGPQTTSAVDQQGRKRRSDPKRLLWRAFSKYHVERRCKATVRVDASRLLDGIPQFTDQPLPTGRSSERLSEAAIAFIDDLNPDFILRYGFGILQGDVLTAARLGVWSYHHGDPAAYRGQPPGFWEIYNDEPVVGSVLQVLNDELDGGVILHSGYFQPVKHSYARTRARLYFGSASWVRVACAKILNNGGPPPSRDAAARRGALYRQPTNRQMISFFGKSALALLKNQIRYKLYRQTWSCGVVKAPIGVVAGLHGAERQAAALAATQWMHNEPHCFSADPFGYVGEDGETVHVLFEHFDWRTGLGTIARRDFDGHKFGPSSEVLATGSHLSYPFVILRDGQPCFIPEHSAARDVSLFKIGEDGRGSPDGAIFTGAPLVDTSFVEHEGKTWAFSTLAGETENSELHLHSAESLDGPWRAHPLNPVKTDVRSARPAGTPFRHGGKLFRPSQDSATHYGSAVTINEVVTLNEHAYEEIAVSRVEPLKGSIHDYGFHTLSSVGDVTLIDGSRKEFRFGVR